jgi:hypothetical protein
LLSTFRNNFPCTLWLIIWFHSVPHPTTGHELQWNIKHMITTHWPASGTYIIMVLGIWVSGCPLIVSWLNWMWPVFFLLHRAFWRFTEYYTPTNALIVYYILV